MGGYVPEDVVENIRNQVDIVNIISEYIPLKRKGKNYTGSCPFHQENDPSFTVSPDKQIFYCFGCAAGGNVFKFLMLYENYTFREAVETLARRTGIDIPAASKKERQARVKRNFASDVNQQASDFFRTILYQWDEAGPAREYLLQRGLSGKTLQHFELGYAPGAWNRLLKHLGRKGYSAGDLVKLGLAVEGRQGSYDRFRSRIMFPIRDASGNIAGFGGRVLGEGQPKYLNTPETEYFNKGRVLYGLYQARRSIMEAGYAVIMEGYMDVISAHQHGVSNAVASLGTSLTREQVKLLMRYTRDAVIAFDADAAGVAAAVRGLDLMQELGCRVRVCSIPGEKDPDEYLQHYGLEGWKALVAAAESLVEYKLRHIKSSAAGEVESKASQLEQILPNLYNIQDEVERTEAIKIVASRLHTTWDAVAGELRRYIKNIRKNSPNSDKIAIKKHNSIHDVQKIDARTKAERILLKLMLENPQWVPSVEQQLEENFFKNKVYNNIFYKAKTLMERSDYNPAILFDKLDETEQEVLGGMLLEDLPGESPAELFNSYIKAMRGFIKKERRKNLMDILLKAEKEGDSKRVSQILTELQALY